MADLAASDITVTIEKKVIEGKRRRHRVKLAFGDGALTYPANGVPMPTRGNLGFKRNVEYLIVTDGNDASGLIWKYDQANHKLRAWQAPARTHAHDLKVIGGQAATTTNEVGHYATDILGKEAATDATIAKADSATKGGVMSETLAAAALVELGNVAVAAQVIYVEAVGW